MGLKFEICCTHMWGEKEENILSKSLVQRCSIWSVRTVMEESRRRGLPPASPALPCTVNTRGVTSSTSHTSLEFIDDVFQYFDFWWESSIINMVSTNVSRILKYLLTPPVCHSGNAVWQLFRLAAEQCRTNWRTDSASEQKCIYIRINTFGIGK